MKENDLMEEYVCTICGFVYDEESAERTVENNIIPFLEISSEWTCPNCGVSPDVFVPAQITESSQEEE